MSEEWTRRKDKNKTKQEKEKNASTAEFPSLIICVDLTLFSTSFEVNYFAEPLGPIAVVLSLTNMQWRLCPRQSSVLRCLARRTIHSADPGGFNGHSFSYYKMQRLCFYLYLQVGLV